MTIEEKWSLHETISLFNRPILAVEIGSYLGASACYICHALKPGSKLICIDTWGNDAMKYYDTDIDGEKRDTYEEFIENTKDFKEKILAIRGWSHEVVDQVAVLGKHIDFLFVDGDHNYDGVCADWVNYSPLLVVGSYVAFHDTGWADGVKKVVLEQVLSRAELHRNLPNMEIYKIIR